MCQWLHVNFLSDFSWPNTRGTLYQIHWIIHMSWSFILKSGIVQCPSQIPPTVFPHWADRLFGDRMDHFWRTLHWRVGWVIRSTLSICPVALRVSAKNTFLFGGCHRSTRVLGKRGVFCIKIFEKRRWTKKEKKIEHRYIQNRKSRSISSSRKYRERTWT